MVNKGFIDLQNIEDYFNKLCWNFDEFKSDTDNVYIAFDFFITALHFLDWLSEVKSEMEKKREEMKSQYVELKVVEHLAIGAKHFIPRDGRHKSVENAIKEKYAEDYFAEDYVEEPLSIILEGKAKEKLGEKINAFELAIRIMEIYRKELKADGIIP